MNLPNSIHMTSREIAKVTGKQHQHIKRDIEMMFASLQKDVSTFGHIYFDSMKTKDRYMKGYEDWFKIVKVDIGNGKWKDQCKITAIGELEIIRAWNNK